MNHSETLRILSVLRAAYPAFYKDMGRETLDGIVGLWQSMLADMPYGVVNAAIRALIAGDRKGYPPHIGAVMDHVRRLTAPSGPDEDQSWSRIERAVANSAYEAEKEFGRLPEELQQIVGSPAQLHAWSQMEREAFDTVVASHIRRSLRARIARQEEMALLPPGDFNGTALPQNTP